MMIMMITIPSQHNREGPRDCVSCFVVASIDPDSIRMTSSFSFVGKLRKRLAHWIGEGTGSTMADDGHALFQLLFPGQRFTADKAGVLAERLRGEAARLERLYASTANGAITTGDRGAVVQAEGLEHASDMEDDLEGVNSSSRKNKKRRSAGKIGLDFSRYQRRNVALQIVYRGFDYQGFARSEHAERTIEAELFAAMEKTRLVPEGVGWRELGYSRGGRTDKGVSAAGQVVALELRSKALVGRDPVEEGDEYDYCRIINSAMSDNVRVIGWKTIGPEFSSRFSARSRKYKYYFVRRGGEFDLGAMREAAGYLVGEHDFRYVMGRLALRNRIMSEWRYVSRHVMMKSLTSVASLRRRHSQELLQGGHSYGDKLCAEDHVGGHCAHRGRRGVGVRVVRAEHCRDGVPLAPDPVHRGCAGDGG